MSPIIEVSCAETFDVAIRANPKANIAEILFKLFIVGGFLIVLYSNLPIIKPESLMLIFKILLKDWQPLNLLEVNTLINCVILS
ncbi:hypothetical protein D3C80_1978930 [compost metagenome]